MAKVPGSKAPEKTELLPDGRGVVNGDDELHRPVAFLKDRQLPVPDEPLIDEQGRLTPAGEKVAIEKGWRVNDRDAPGSGITGHLKE